jgi:hypothetical protein
VEARYHRRFGQIPHDPGWLIPCPSGIYEVLGVDEESAVGHSAVRERLGGLGNSFAPRTQ